MNGPTGVNVSKPLLISHGRPFEIASTWNTYSHLMTFVVNILSTCLWLSWECLPANLLRSNPMRQNNRPRILVPCPQKCCTSFSQSQLQAPPQSKFSRHL